LTAHKKEDNPIVAGEKNKKKKIDEKKD